MDTPAQATKITAIAILVAVLLSILFTALNTNKKMLLASVDKQAEMSMENYGDDFNSYINTEIDGYKLRGLLKSSVNKDIKIIVRNQDETDQKTFDFRTNSFSTTKGEAEDKTRSNFFLVDNSSLSGVDQMIGDIEKDGWYIDPFSTYQSSARVVGQQVSELYFDQI